MEEYKFTHEDWVTSHTAKWLEFAQGTPRLWEMLELGTFEGRAAVWLGKNILPENGWLYAVDTWEGSAEHSHFNMEKIEENFDNNLWEFNAHNPHKIIFKKKMTTHEALSTMSFMRFGWIYVDASHKARDVLSDAVMAWHLLVKGGVMVFDDYAWEIAQGELNRPKIALDAFLSIFGDELDILDKHYQLIVRKK